jgi:glycosyltransferase involved in cell wall biosynthesis
MVYQTALRKIMNILVASRGIPSKRDPQWGSFEFDQAKALASMGHHVTVVAVDTRFRFYWRKIGLTARVQDGIQTYNLFYCPAAVLGLLGRRFRESVIRWQWNKLARIVAEEKHPVDIIYAHYLFNAYYAVQCFQEFNAPVVGMEHWSELNREPMKRNVIRMAEYTYPRLAHLLAVSEPLKARIKEKFGIQATVVHNMIGKDYRYAPDKQPRPFTFISVGSLRKMKGFDSLLNAFAQTRLPKDKWRLTIVGDGSEAPHLRRLIHSLQLQENVMLVGQKNAKEINALLNRSDVFVLASRSETFGVVYIEAMSCGLPVIATECGGPADFVTKQNGLLVPVDDVKGLTHCLEHMYTHYQEYDRQAIAKDCQARFSAEVIARQLTDIFEHITNTQ